MSAENICAFVRGLIQEDDSLTDANTCRDSVSKIAEVLKEQFPKAKVSVLAYPEAKEGENVHYAVLFRVGERDFIINAVKAPGFPLFIGELENAAPTFGCMKEVSEIC